ncbi:MAG TPA: hypothetical protein VFI42_12300, partial [Thermomicrobiaceae bacterium]|nr:hypothetical protein [Thermomicrobiaceae bacterium]
ANVRRPGLVRDLQLASGACETRRLGQCRGSWEPGVLARLERVDDRRRARLAGRISPEGGLVAPEKRRGG